MSLDAANLPMLAVIGESNADPMLGAYLLDPASRLPLAVCALAHIPALQSAYYLDQQGRVNSKIVAALCTLRLLMYCGLDHPKAVGENVMERNLYSEPDGYGWRINEALKDTPILFMSGEVDARKVIIAVPPHADVPVPFPWQDTDRIPTFKASATISEESLTSAITATLAPMFQAIGILKHVGFSAIALHSISPPTADDAQFLHQIHYDTRALTRYKVTMLFNAAMRRHCKDHDFLFVDRWDDFTDGGLIRDGYGSDAVHMKAPHMRVSLQRLYEMTIGRPTNANRRAQPDFF